MRTTPWLLIQPLKVKHQTQTNLINILMRRMRNVLEKAPENVSEQRKIETHNQFQALLKAFRENKAYLTISQQRKTQTLQINWPPMLIILWKKIRHARRGFDSPQKDCAEILLFPNMERILSSLKGIWL